ncbi:TonB-dependent receptor domain-containing protein [Sphingobium sp. B11D3D]|uniref:TonB-dependent receptor domain-containing protein n=1 Tax=Sphingobium sp. B11D3D TaxID=2940576 RepID=UPI0022255102|nr:TonB-dependent receptor [Sphingobium sp. B11D3D]MCW2369448.1 outer membrane receptor protein involved in Fe transport [Sphingobium sp. B11D3D]
MFMSGFNTRGALMLGAAATALVASAAQAKPVDFDIPSQPLPSALRTFGLQSGTSIVFSASSTGYGPSVPIKGQYEPKEALARLLGSAPLQPLERGSGFTVVRMEPRPAAAMAAPAPAAPAPQAMAQAEPAPEAEEGDAIVVTGSRIARSGFTAPTPVTQLGSERLANTSAASVGEALAQLPAFRATTSPTTSGVTIGAGGARTVDLRGLGAQRSLVLVDGRRFVPSTIAGAVDTNLIPGILINRVELVTGGASAAYGSDAVAGVVNFILDKKLQGFRVNVQAGISERGEDSDQLIAAAAGTSFAGGRGHIIIGGEYNNNRGMGGCYSYDLCAQEWQVLTNTAYRTNGQAARIISPNVRTATQTYAGKINAPTALATIQFDDAGNPVPFVRGQYATLFMQGGSGQGQNAFRSAGVLKVPVERYALYGRTEYELGAVTPFIDVSYGRVRVITPGAQTRDTNLTINRDNPYLPRSIVNQMTTLGAQTLTFGRVGQDLGVAVGDNVTKTFRIVGGFDADLGNGWKADAYYQFGQTDASQIVENNRITANFTRALDAVDEGRFRTGVDNGNIVCRATLSPNAAVRAAATGCQPLNLFGQYRFSEAARAYSFGTSEQRTRFQQHVVAANLRGDLFDFGSGPVSIAVGGEYRSERVSGTADPISLTNGFYIANASSFGPETINIVEGYAETVVPLLRDMSGIELLEFNGAIRRTNYSTSGSVTTWKLGGIYEPVEGVRFRGTRSRDIRAPNAAELYTPLVASQGSIFDISNSSQVLARVFRGGNQALRPEIADTTTAGVVLQPRMIPGLRFSADYYDIKIRDAIDLVGAQVITDRCNAGGASYCALITRDTGPSGLITDVVDQYLNVNQIKTRGIDFELDFSKRFGADNRIAINLLATRVFDLIQVDATGSLDRAGQTGRQVGGPIGVPKYTLDGTFTFEKGPFGATVQGHYIPKGSYDASLIGPDDPNYSNTLANSIDNNVVDDMLTFNLSLRYTIGGAGDSTMQIYAAINNLFDTDPPIAPGNSVTNPVFFDQTGRSYRAGVRLKF